MEVFLDIVNHEIEKSLRHQDPLTLAYVDVDEFKQINNQFGLDSHRAKATVIQTVATRQAKAVPLRLLQLFFQRNTLCG
ncbi:diguanylate cyclase domain-containing protein, partial [Anabaena azotica]|uniref:diguanylate cyclase domain-containing protein n=1 Tax=Anabaena azotica TaxID=197653 RepID=UPI0028C42128